MAQQVVVGLIADSQTTSSVNSSLDEDTTAASFTVPDEHAVPIDIAETKGVLSCHREYMYSEGSTGIRIDSKIVTGEAGSQAECRICQEEEVVQKLETPCACSGSMKYAHQICIQRWCYEKGDTVCEICHKPFGNGYKTIAGASHAEMTPRPLNGEQESTFSDNEIDYPHLVTMDAPEVDFQHPDSDSDKYRYTFVWGFFFLLLLIAFVFYLQGEKDSDLALGIAFFGAGSLCCLRYMLTIFARAVVVHQRQLHQMAVSAGIHRRRRQQRRRQQHQVAMGADVDQRARNLELATDLHEHPIMIAAEVERSREQGA